MTTRYPLIRTKIRTPRLRASVLRRPRLVNYLHANIQHKLILVSAGAGYGKTTLLVDYAHDTDLPICWYSLDRHDSNALTFAEYLVASIRERFPDFGASVLGYLEARDGPAEDIEPIIRLLVNEIEDHTGDYFVIVLDDYHEVIESEPVNAVVDGLLRYLPEHCHIILASRAIPRRLTLTRLAARQEVVGLGVEDLRFTPDEIRAVLEDLGYADLTAEQVETVAERTEGWITGVLLAAQASRGGALRDIIELTGANTGVFDYMAEEILARQTEPLQQFLLGSALFARMSPPLCNALLGISNAADLLRELSDRNLFTIPMDAEGSWYQYHQMFREFLLAKFERDDPERCRTLFLKQAGIMAHEGDWHSAIVGYLQAKAFEQAADALEIIAQDTYDAGHWDVLKDWIDSLPQQVCKDHPRLLLFRAKIHTETSELRESATLLEVARQTYIARRDDIGAARVLAQMAVVQRFRGLLKEAVATSEQALRLANGRDPLAIVQATREIGISHCMLGQYDDGLRHLGEALRVAQENADDTNSAFIALDMGTAQVSLGHLASARQYYHQSLLYWRRVGNASGLAATLQSLGIVHHYLGQYAEAENRFLQGLDKARSVQDVRVETYSLASLADLYRETRRYDEALQQYEKGRERAKMGLAQMNVYLLDGEANTYRLMGRLVQADQILIEALDQARSANMTQEMGLCNLSLGAIALERRDTSAARDHVQTALDLLSRVNARRDVARGHLYLAAIEHADGHRAAWEAALERVRQSAEQLGTIQFVVAESPTMGEMLRDAERQRLAGLHYDQIREEIERLEPAATQKVAATTRGTRHRLEFLALQGGQVLKSGQVVTQWESVSAKHMAFLFVGHPEGLRRDRVIDLLWPEVGQEKGNSLFHSTIYRMRSALYKDFVIHQNSVYRTNSEYDTFYDVLELLWLAKQGEGDDELAHAARLEAIGLYQTPFLETMDCEWSLAMREQLHTEIVGLLIHEARYLAQHEARSDAEELFQRARRLEPYDERAYRGIMWCRAINDDRAGAVRQYRQCARTLREELDTEPSSETTRLFEQIRSGTTRLRLH